MQFLVPQFIDIESKIIGPISGRQFIISIITMALCYIWFELFPAFIFVPAIFVTGAIGGTLAFAKVNGQRMHYFLLNVIQTLKRPRLTVWHRLSYEKPAVISAPPKPAFVPKEAPNQSRLAEMSLMVDTGGVYVAQEQTKKEPNTKS